ncbi:MAG: Na/Pi cotransporter family protein [Bacillota bacterium]|uniref:Sodium-dependent phosphate transporter n=1 Tax=Thermanaerosceptrum fracticalcis TaxID=1712410 RepID=A0A7G6E5D4_THEFR|nr:Na/Pi cotransporter family protein [Thermanaerosceptrum fracticalcis]QNB47288.1 sodium-dependent phosphate transporter [Thermanaerosceptrum fracticalcis]
MKFNYQEILFLSLGGLAFFLFGIKYMSDGLQSVAGDKMRAFLEKGTKTPLRGVLTGTLVTALIQSSSGTTVLTVGLVNAGLLSLRQAIGIIMGANIGTTVTAYLIGFKLGDYALPIAVVGTILLFFSKNKRLNTIGQVLFGFALLFYGMEVMGKGLKPLKNIPFFINAMTNIENMPVLGVLVGTVFTGIVQSSSATIGILQELAYQGAVTYHQAVPILFGDNIGTTITALLASIGTSVTARRAALTHFMFNLIGTIIFLPLFLVGIFPEIVRLFTDYIYILIPGFEGTWETLNIKMQIAQTHGVFNVSNTIIHLPFVSLLAAFVTKLIPGEDKTLEFGPKYLEPRLLGNPSVALSQAGREVLRMGMLAKESFSHAVAYFFTGLENEAKQSLQLEEIIDDLENKITEYIVKISEKKMSTEESNQAYIYIQAVNDIERVGDHTENIVELTKAGIDHGIRFSIEAIADMRKMIDKTQETYVWALESLEKNDFELAKKVVKNDDYIDEMEKEFRRAHITRLNEGVCNGNAGAIYLDILSNLERIGDHSVNIAQYVLGER